MQKVIINHNFCDEAPECGGIQVCPSGAFRYNLKNKKVEIDEEKCTKCLHCTLPDVCPVGCILFARSSSEIKELEEVAKKDTRKTKWLWHERYGCEPGKTKPLAFIINEKNFEKIIKKENFKLIDSWNIDYLDCRKHSQLLADLIPKDNGDIGIYKIATHKFPQLTKKLGVKVFPTLLLYYMDNEILRHEGFLNEEEMNTLKDAIKSKIKKMS
ncbi:hypothetical protein JW887_00105 [Candidatus Dojkabacteria bacterium]|nr:hypothetical protein [Candidatus Dojkabacteria bacterium]